MKLVTFFALATTLFSTVSLNAMKTHDITLDYAAELEYRAEYYTNLINTIGADNEPTTKKYQGTVNSLFAPNCTKTVNDTLLYETHNGVLPQLFNAKSIWPRWRLEVQRYLVDTKNDAVTIHYTCYATTDTTLPITAVQPVLKVMKTLQFNEDVLIESIYEIYCPVATK